MRSETRMRNRENKHKMRHNNPNISTIILNTNGLNIPGEKSRREDRHVNET